MAAELLTVSPDTVYDLFKRGELPGRKVGRKWLTTRNAVLRWIESSKVNAAVLSTPLLFFLKSFVFSEFLTILNIKLLIILCFLTRKSPSVYTWYVQYLDYSWILPCERMSMTTKTIHISLPESLKEYMDERVAEEHYSTFSDYIRALVREDQKRYAEERLEKLLLEGLESGRGAALGSKEWKQFKKRVLSRAKGRKPRA